MGKAGMAGLALFGLALSPEPANAPSVEVASESKVASVDDSKTILTPGPSLVPQRRVSEIFGWHDTPEPGGSRNIDMAVQDVQELGVRWGTFIDPSERLVERMIFQAKVLPIIRIPQELNRYNRATLKKGLDKVVPYTLQIGVTIIQPYNEVMLKKEVGSVPVLPEDHIRNDFIPAVRQVAGYDPNARILLTPLARRSPPVEGIDEQMFLRRMARELAHFPDEQKRVDLALHPYFFPGEDHNKAVWPYAKEMAEIFEAELGRKPNIYFPEAGPYQLEQQWEEEVYAREVRKILEEGFIPAELNVKAYNFWLYANDEVQRPRGTRVPPEFNAAAWRDINGPRKVFKEVAALRLNNYRYKEAAQAA